MSVASNDRPSHGAVPEQTQWDTWAVLDFETATGSRDSACAVGLVLVDQGVPTRQGRWLIRPPRNEYDEFNVAIHGIRPEHTAKAPNMRQVWAQLDPLVRSRVLLAHNAGFDISVLHHSLAGAGGETIVAPFACTLVLARQALPRLHSYSLPVVADAIGVDFVHHDPLEDARACAELGRYLSAQDGFRLDVTCARYDVHTGALSAGLYAGCCHTSDARRFAELVPAGDVFDPTHPLFGRTVVFTGALGSMHRAEAAQRVVDLGGRCVNTVSAKVDYLVVGWQELGKLAPGQTVSAKRQRFEELHAAGAPIELITEKDLLALLSVAPSRFGGVASTEPRPTNTATGPPKGRSAPAEKPTQPAPPSAWYPDPTRRHELRYWDGTAWTDHVSDAGRQALDPV